MGVEIPANFGLISDEFYTATLMEDVGQPIESLKDLSLDDRRVYQIIWHSSSNT